MKNHARLLLDYQTQQVLLENVELANTAWTRFRGWMFRTQFQPKSGILIQPCRSIHTMWMRVTIDVYFLSNENVVLGCRHNIKPWRIVMAPRGTVSVLETLPGEMQIENETKLKLESA